MFEGMCWECWDDQPAEKEVSIKIGSSFFFQFSWKSRYKRIEFK
jgi:hypothetical protein